MVLGEKYFKQNTTIKLQSIDNHAEASAYNKMKHYFKGGIII